MQMKQTTQV